jgi:hypothetical protein
MIQMEKTPGRQPGGKGRFQNNVDDLTIFAPEPVCNDTEAVRRIIARFHLPRATAGTVAVLAGLGGAQ